MSGDRSTRFPKSNGNLAQIIISTIRQHPREIIIENTVVNFAAIVGGIGSLIFTGLNVPAGAIGIFVLSLAIVVFGVIAEAKKYIIYTQDSLPIPIVINIANPANGLDALNSLFRIIEQESDRLSNYQKNIHKYLGIATTDLVYKFEGDIFDTEKLKDFLKIIKHDLEKVKQKTPQNSQFYLVYIGPISVAFLIGAMLPREGLKIFQRDQQTNSYRSITEVRDRLLKEKIAEFENFQLTTMCSDPPSTNVTIAIDTASHKIKLNDPEIQSYGDIISLENKHSNTISFDEDWLQYCREIFHTLNEAQQQYQEIKLVYSMPIGLAIAVGMTIQNFWNIQLTNYDGQTGQYLDLIKMNDIKYYY
jgi:hypothetical protein